MVPVPHLYSVSFGYPSAERKVEEFETEIGGCHSMSLSLLSQGNSLLIYKELSWLFCLHTTPKRRSEIKVMFEADCCMRVTAYLFHPS